MDDCGQLTIRCSQDYFSLDCGITAYELSDYSPGDEAEAPGYQRVDEDEDDRELRGPNPEPASEEEGEGVRLSNHEHHSSLPELAANLNCSPSAVPTMQCGTPNPGESAKRPLQGVSHSAEVSPTQPSLPKRAVLLSEGRPGDSRGDPLAGLQFQAELSRSTPSLVNPPDRSKFWLELDSVYPENVSQSHESLQVGDSSPRGAGETFKEPFE